MTKNNISIIIPAYNEAASIATTLAALREQYPDYEIIVIDDGSTDQTGNLARQSGVSLLTNTVNKGYGASLKKGIRNASGDIIVLFDADGQHDVHDVKRLIDKLENCTMVVGARRTEDQVFVRRPGKWFLQRIAEHLVEQKIPDLNSGLRAFRKKDALPFFGILPNGFSFTTTITLAMLHQGLDVEYIPIKVAPRNSGTSRVSFLKDGPKTGLLICRVIMLFNPLKIFMPVSLFIFAVGTLYNIYTVAAETNITELGIFFILVSVIIGMFGLLADQLSNIRRS